MIFAYDRYKKLKAPKIFLAKPSKEYIGILHTTLPNGKLRFNDISEMNFTIYSHIDGLPNLYYDQVTTMKLVEIQNIGWFHIATADETEDGINSFKEITLKSLECELCSKKVYDINGVFKLQDNDHSKSLMDIITSELNWDIGTIDNTLLTKSRTFSIDSQDVYSLLTADIATSFGCIIQFDTYEKKIHVRELSNLSKDTNIIMSHKNLVLQNVISSDKDNIKTVFRVVGGDGLDIRAVNPTGSNKIINVDYFMTTEYMSQELIDALNVYKNKYNKTQSLYTTALNELNILQKELSALNNKVPDASVGESTTDLKNYGLIELNTKLSEQKATQGTLVSAGASNESDGAHEHYKTVLSIIQSIEAEITIRMSAILAKESAIKAKENEIAIINTSLTMQVKELTDKEKLTIESNFTNKQICELQNFLMYEDDYTDTTYVVGDTDSASEILQVKQQLYDAASTQLDIVSKPQETIKTDSKNIFALAEFANEQHDFSLGNFITIFYRVDLYTTLRLLEIEIDFADITKLDLTFSNKNKLDSCAIQLAEITDLAKSTSNSLSLSKIGYDKASSLTDPIQEFMNSSLNATTNQVINGKNKEVTFGEFGLRCREWLEDQQKYDVHESWWNNNTLLFSDNNFKSSKTGIGLWDDGSGNKYYGFLGDVIVGKIFLGERLSIYNNAGTFTIKDDTGFQANAAIGTNTYNVGINPSTPSEIFNIKVNGTNQLYVDTINNKLVFTGKIDAGEIEGTSISASTINGTNITGGLISGSNFISNYNNSGDNLSLKLGSWDTFGLQCRVDFSTGAFMDTSYGYNGITGSRSDGFCANYKLNVMELHGADRTITIKAIDGTNGGGIQGLDETSKGNPYLNGKAVGTTSWVLDNFSKNDHAHSTSQINIINNGNNNISFANHELYGASTFWVLANFERISCDERLKEDISDINCDIVKLYTSFSPKQFRFKAKTTYNNKIHTMLTAQGIMKNFEDNGLNWKDYDIIEEKDITDTDFCGDIAEYTNGENYYAINDKNLHAYHIAFGKELYKENQLIKNRISNLESELVNLKKPSVNDE